MKPMPERGCPVLSPKAITFLSNNLYMLKAKRPYRAYGYVWYALPGESYCKVRHVPRKRSAKAATWYRLYTTGRQRRARDAYLQEYSLCVEHNRERNTVFATVVEHIIPHRGEGRLFLSEDNWQALCQTCHDHKTAKENDGFSNAPFLGGCSTVGGRNLWSPTHLAELGPT